MGKEQKQVCDMKAGKRMSVALSNEQLRVGDKTAWNAKIAGNLDTTRSHLNFEVKKGGVITEVDQKSSIGKRLADIFRKHGIQDPNAGISDDNLQKKGVGVRTFASFILNGSTETMRQLAFGDQKVNWERDADNSHITRNKAIEKWAVDMYNFMAKKYGEENIASFVVHLDESNPHVHCTVAALTEQEKLSFKQVFVGENKYEYSKRTKELHDEMAAVNEKYGLKRGDSTLKTGAQHKSYLQWMKESINKSMETLQSNNEEIQKNTETISEQNKTIYAINDQIKQANKKLKGLTTMLNNLQEKKESMETEITALEEEYQNGEISKEELQEKINELNEKIRMIEQKISDKSVKLKEAQQELEDLATKKFELKREYEEMMRQINKVQPTLEEKTNQEINSTLWQQSMTGLKNDYNALQEFAKSLPPEQQEKMQNILEDSFLEDVAERGNEITAVSMALFLGYVDQALTFVKGQGGGGGGSSSGWGRKEDEDDLRYRHRCCMMGRQMMRPAGVRRKR